jgi:transcription initiation factor TFIID subunit 3
MIFVNQITVIFKIFRTYIHSDILQDNDGNKVWICPACGGQDDGSPMIGCDDCDAWYHW